MAQDDIFDSPASGKFDAKLYKGRLLIITPREYLPTVTTTFGTKDAIDCTIVVVDEANPSESEVIDNGRLFSGPLIGATKSKIGRMVLGRLNQGQPKPGQQPPWLLDDPTDADRKVAGAYIATKAPQL